MNRDEQLMTIAMEECAEVAQRLSKALRFGMEQIQQDPGDKPEENPERLTNSERIRREYSDLAAALEMLGIGAPLGRWMDEKRAKVERYLAYSEALGTLTAGSHELQGEARLQGAPKATGTKAGQASHLQCDHKFVDSTFCLKCGWDPSPAREEPPSRADAGGGRAELLDDYEWAHERVVKMAAAALVNARIYGKKLLKGFGYPDEAFSHAQDARALQIVLAALSSPPVVDQGVREAPAERPVGLWERKHGHAPALCACSHPQHNHVNRSGPCLDADGGCRCDRFAAPPVPALAPADKEQE